MFETLKRSCREFLSSTTIHGLGYIITGKSFFFQCLWAGAVLTSFATAGYLIKDSFDSWSSSPVVSSLSTQQIDKISNVVGLKALRLALFMGYE